MPPSGGLRGDNMKLTLLLFVLSLCMCGCDVVANDVVFRLHVESLIVSGLGGSIVGMIIAYIEHRWRLDRRAD